jgi:hypothetical protein
MRLLSRDGVIRRPLRLYADGGEGVNEGALA